MAVQFSNNAATNLSAAISASATSITVADASEFPTLSGSDYTYVTLSNLLETTVEVVKVTAISGNTLTVVRGQDNTTAASFASGDKCELRVTAALLNDVAEQADTNTEYTAGSGITLTGTVFSNSTPDQTVTLTGSGATSVSGTYPNFTISSTDTNTDTNTEYTAGSGLTLTGTVFSNSAPDQTVSLTGSGATSVSGTYPNFTISSADTNTTYSVGDGGLTQNNFTNALKSKLDGVEASADVTDTANVVSALTAGTNVTIASNGTISSTDTNTTYSVGNGGLTQINFTSALNSKLAGIESGATADQSATEIRTALLTVDGSGSGLDADLLDGQQGSYYYPASNPNGYTNDQTAAEILTAIKTVDGSGSGLDADLLDNYDSSRFMRRQNKATATAGAGWMTVATCTGSRHHGEIMVTDADSGDHALIRIEWLRSYADSAFTVLNCGGHGNRITGARVLYQTADNTYGVKLLQVYVTTSSNYEVNVFELGDIQDYGVHTAVTPVIENSKTGYAVHGNSLEGLDAHNLAAEEGILAGGIIDGMGGFDVNGTNVIDSSRNITTPNITTPNVYINDTNTRISEGSNNAARIQTDSGYVDIGAMNTSHAHIYTDRSSFYFNKTVLYANGHLIWHANNDGSGSGLDADTVDGLQGSSFLRSNAADTFTGTITMGTQQALVPNGYGRGLFGLYNSTRYQHVWSMGIAYKTSDDGTSYGNMYGLTYTHTNVGTGTNQAIAGLSHQLQHRINGSLTAAIGSGIWTNGNVTAYSDIAVKTNLVKIPNALEKVCAINGYTYERTDYVKDLEDPEAPDILRQAGVVAQEVEKILPEVVSGEEGNKAVAYGNMVSLLIEAIKELDAKVEELKRPWWKKLLGVK